MELTKTLVHDRIADLNRVARELRIERAVRDAPAHRSARPVARPRPARLIGAWLVGLGTALGGRDVEAAGPVAR